MRVTLDMTVHTPDSFEMMGNVTKWRLRTHTIVPSVGDTGAIDTATTTTAAPIAKDAVVLLAVTNQRTETMQGIGTMSVVSPSIVMSLLVLWNWVVNGGEINSR